MKKIASILLILTIVLSLTLISCTPAKPDAPADNTPVSSADGTPASVPTAGSEGSGKTTDDQPATPDVPKDIVYVSIVDENGTLVLQQAPIGIDDLNNDGKLTIDEALTCTHETAFEGGAAGYESGETQYGISIFKLWGSHDKYSFGYYLNGQMAMGLTDEVKAGDYLDAFVYLDQAGYSDVYSCFDKRIVETHVASDVSLTLSKLGFDENYMPVFSPVGAGVTIVINGENTDFTTNDQGEFTVAFKKTGTYVISASSADIEGLTIVPPVCIVTVS